ncbi:MAG TPA: TetR family transcriptional regulator [Trebonia sp.]|jgi:AcrR family transcriptional regulator|nr:TetR family transcriptional regulator [Trebonia sp.]
MAWHVAETKAKLKAAAVEEFAERGLAGTRVESIARRAGVNKERLYNYFGSKEDLFALVLSEELDRFAESVPMLAEDGDDIGAYAGRCFDYHCDHPVLIRLQHWEALELPAGKPVPDEDDRASRYAHKTAAIAQAQRDGRVIASVDARDLVFAIIAMSSWWAAVPQLARMVTGADDSPAERARRRASVVAIARRLAPDS